MKIETLQTVQAVIRAKVITCDCDINRAEKEGASRRTPLKRSGEQELVNTGASLSIFPSFAKMSSMTCKTAVIPC
jgi:hypothetical protein